MMMMMMHGSIDLIDSIDWMSQGRSTLDAEQGLWREDSVQRLDSIAMSTRQAWQGLWWYPHCRSLQSCHQQGSIGMCEAWCARLCSVRLLRRSVCHMARTTGAIHVGRSRSFVSNCECGKHQEVQHW